MPSRRIDAGVLVVVLAAALVGCGEDDTASAPPSGGGAPPSIAIRNFAFVPAELAALRGQGITVTNEDKAPHTITAVDGSFDSGELAQGQSFTFAPVSPGTVNYICDLHQYMKGTLTVR